MSKKRKKVTVKTAEKVAVAPKSIRNNVELTFGKENYKWLVIGIALMVIGMLLMIGGFNENPNVWDESQIYGFRRTVLAPFFILSGLAVNIYALFK